MKTRILICDDREEGCENARLQLKRAGLAESSIRLLPGDALRVALAALFEETGKLLQGEETESDGVSIPEELRGFDVVIFDNNLAELNFGGMRLTAEAIIGRLRAFADNSYIVSLNKNPNVDFDLRHLFGDHHSIADLALNTSHLSRPRLWGGRDDEFSPWYWPSLPSAASRRRKQIDFVRENLEETVWDTLGFPDNAEDYMSRRSRALGSRSPNGQSVKQVSFLDVFRANSFIDREAIESIVSLAALEVPWAVEAVCRVASAEIDRWLRREILAPQDVLVDLPHLVARMPSLLGEAGESLSAWNNVVSAENPPYGLQCETYERHLSNAEFRPAFWSASPCLWWPTLKTSAELQRQLFDCSVKWPDVVFCEDVSAFIERKSLTPIEIEAEIEGSWPRRYIVQRAGLNFSPRSRIVG